MSPEMLVDFAVIIALSALATVVVIVVLAALDYNYDQRKRMRQRMVEKRKFSDSMREDDQRN